MKQNTLPNLTSESSTGKLGTFAGVFTPSVLTILGIILFLRLGYVVGNAGLGRALIMIGLANAISVLTSISLAAISTNLKVKGGGDYYLISRTLGVEFGGAIGIVLFLAQSVSIAFYCMGFGEAMADILTGVPWLSTRMIAGIAVSLLFVLAWLGADWATRFQYGVMILISAALVSFFWGGLSLWDSAVFSESWRRPSLGLPFWALFAIFFPRGDRVYPRRQYVRGPEGSREESAHGYLYGGGDLHPGLFRGGPGVCGGPTSGDSGGGLWGHVQSGPFCLSY